MLLFTYIFILCFSLLFFCTHLDLRSFFYLWHTLLWGFLEVYNFNDTQKVLEYFSYPLVQ